MKKLICTKDVETMNKQGKKVCYFDGNTVITPSAKDLAKLCGIEFSFESDYCVGKAPEALKTCGSEIDSDMIYTVLKAMVDKSLLKGLLESASNQPYLTERDSSGLKLVRGDSVRYDKFDTGNPNNKVFHQELISKNDSTMNAGFLSIENCSYEWELCYEELNYVIEGTLTITINGKTVTAYPGDVLYVPSGIKVVWGSPDKAKVFYATYPSNGADLVYT